jgi:mannose-6-phosphate isomerase-like protein (cupin superfamily)
MNFKELPDRWSILEIVEHLEVQDEMYWRELDILPRGPKHPEFVEQVKGNDELLLQYKDDPSKADAGYLHPIGRFYTKELAVKAFTISRDRIIDFIKSTPKDLRLYFTFRKYEDDGGLTDPGIYDVRDLHQLMLTCIAHTQRHIKQLEKVKAHPDFPQNNPFKIEGGIVHVENINTWLPIGSEPGYEELQKVCRYLPLIGGNYENWKGIPLDDVLFGELELEAGGYYPAHHHPAPEIYYVLSGEAEWTVGDQTFIARPGASIYHPANKLHKMHNKGKEALKVIYFWWAPGGDKSTFKGYKFLENAAGVSLKSNDNQ